MRDGLMIGMTGYVVLATAWGLFSGPTRYVSLATVAFFGIGAYTVAVLSETLPYPLVLLVAALIGLAVALVVGLSTLRLAGVYFVIFTFGLAELIRQLVTWYEVNVTGTLGRYIFLPLGPEGIYWQLLALAAATFLLSWGIDRTRWGLALKVIGDDEVVASHCGIDITRTKLALFVHQRRHHHAGRRDPGAALDLYRAEHRLQPDHLVPHAHHGAAWRGGRDCGARCSAPSRCSCCSSGCRPTSRTTIRSSSASSSSPSSSCCRRACCAALRKPARQGRPQNERTRSSLTGLTKRFGGLTAVNGLLLAMEAARSSDYSDRTVPARRPCST
jgi:hypothetical protein